LAIVDDGPIGDALEFQLFYSVDASNGKVRNYDGKDPIHESDLKPDGAHLFFVEKSGDLALFVVYKRDTEATETRSADATLSAAGGA
jgi:hypothetical protein